MNSITLDEQKAIKSWTSPLKEYRYIKRILKGEKIDFSHDFYEKRANDLINMFSKYQDNTNKQVLYRGDVFESLKEFQECLLKGIGDMITFEDTVLSFSLSRDIAEDSYKRSDKMKNADTPSILFILGNRKSTFLNISKYSAYPNEAEVICNRGLKFVITSIEKQINNHLIFYIEEI